MAGEPIMKLSVHEVCQAAGITRETLIEIVHEGIVEPRGATAGEWEFDTDALTLLRRAARLQADFELEWGGIALVIDMLNELEKARSENELLRRRLNRFLID